MSVCVYLCVHHILCVYLCVHHILFICSFVDGRFWLFAFLVFVNNVAMNIGIQVCVSLLLVLLCEIGGLYGNSV